MAMPPGDVRTGCACVRGGCEDLEGEAASSLTPIQRGTMHAVMPHLGSGGLGAAACLWGGRLLAGGRDGATLLLLPSARHDAWAPAVVGTHQQSATCVCTTTQLVWSWWPCLDLWSTSPKVQFPTGEQAYRAEALLLRGGARRWRCCRAVERWARWSAGPSCATASSCGKKAGQKEG